MAFRRMILYLLVSVAVRTRTSLRCEGSLARLTMPDYLSPAIAFGTYGLEATSDYLRDLTVANQSFVRGLVAMAM